MDRTSAITAWGDSFLQILSDAGTRMLELIPNLVGALLVLVAGWLLARLAEAVAVRLLRLFGVDRAGARLRLDDFLERAGLRMAPSEVLGRVLFWTLLVVFLLASVQTLGLDAVTTTVDRLVAFFPDLMGAVLILILGLLLARFLGTVVSSGAAAAGFERAPRLGFAAQLAIAVLVVVVALEQLGVETSVLVGPLTAILAAAGISAGVAFALGARPIVTHILAGHFLKQSLPRDAVVETDGRRGVVERVGAIDTLFRDGEARWSVPNGKLLELVVKR